MHFDKYVIVTFLYSIKYKYINHIHKLTNKKKNNKFLTSFLTFLDSVINISFNCINKKTLIIIYLYKIHTRINNA